MAGFFKKVFSFGRKEVVEERVDETAPLPPIKWDALEALKPEAQPAPHPPLDGEGRHEVAGRGDGADAGADRPHARAALGTSPIEGEVEAAPQPAPEEPKPEPSPAIPQPPEPTIPAEPEPLPQPKPEEEPQRTPETPEPPAPVEVPTQPVRPEPAPEPQPQEVPPPAPVEPEIVPSQPEPQPEPAPVEIPATVPEIPVEAPTPEIPPAEVMPPVRQPAPVEPEPVRAEIAPEIEAAPTPHPPLDGEGRHEVAGRGAGADAGASHPHPRAALGTSPIGGEVGPAPVSQPSPKPASSAGKVTVAKKVEQKAEPQKAPEPAPRRSWFQRMRDGLARSSRELSGNIAGVFTKRKLDEDTLQDLEDVLIRADLGLETALRVTDALASSRYGKDVSDTEVRSVMAAEVEKVLTPVALPLELDLSHKPHVILVVGVNGTGKTTTIGKLAAKLTDGGLSVMLAAGDTFRAAAIEQLKIWGERTKSPVIASKLGADAAGLAYDAFEKAKEAGSDVLIIDTAGRLQNKAELMAELEKIVRVLGKLDPEAPHTVLQTVDATTGQNALSQVEIFRNVAGVNGLVMTKLDGTARGGILVAIAAKHRLPVYFIGVGEQVDDLEPFSASEFARAIAGVA
ncbi:MULTISPECIES: signal recognition particle-docking protein FtsY [unclassified Mesorhizobium]|uniref:signal recognition particle-docking protein FtsY n=1 Tax=unclassified Mesorhizobium TaxID=325217 RepID=UPI000FCC5225|nr:MULTISPECIES: signal recognition particle-docking protein FtsY [unclassified Mesorhizobium]TGP22015.1 signal recognition particle-docking protein FtsY [Mesorhizobium sp. M1D.F.Ca.ET.231.01.1.1]TGP30400.1 signal recognition particle-docking protein FtsY [Mesorhizobium sp. M1D.F.Ca.ET.234.01.1.1]TGS44476.1 signal recognition particle-docking protein FtsY [Mesorhizobium sp. M1D.F.Ca.ET.184.01.1.1]TGS60516.1 signal recognition particle-docking protein FtsY [Mesorhizobium sp. M1D.F.Ca.ET.183.01.1